MTGPFASVRAKLGAGGLGPLNEEGNGGVGREWDVLAVGRRGAQRGEWILLLAGDAEGGAAGGENLESGRLGQEACQARGGGEDLFQVVENQQGAAMAEEVGENGIDRALAGFAQTQGAGDGGEDEVGIDDGGEGNDRHAIRDLRGDGVGCGEGETSLADTAGSRDRHEAGAGGCEHGDEIGEIGVATEKRTAERGVRRQCDVGEAMGG